MCFDVFPGWERVRVGRIELPSSAWKADILPLNYTRKLTVYSVSREYTKSAFERKRLGFCYNTSSMGKTNKQRIGALGEHVAREYLSLRGYRVQGCNLRSRRGEIDILARAPSGRLSFIEVKSVEVSRFDQTLVYDPLEKLSPRKIGRLYRTIESYIHEQDIQEDWQLDAVVVYLNPSLKEARCTLYEHISRD